MRAPCFICANAQNNIKVEIEFYSSLQLLPNQEAEKPKVLQEKERGDLKKKAQETFGLSLETTTTYKLQ